jgi:phage FluMu gp28-like protein
MSKEAEQFFLPYQQRWIKDQSRLKIMEKSRQIGMSWSTAYGIVRRKSLRDAKLDAWISSRDDLQARLFKEDCNAFAQILNLAVSDLGQPLIDEGKKISAYVLELANGCRIHSMSSNPDAQAGKRGDRILDEFALHPDPRKLYSIAFPGITWGGSMEIISTHRGSKNYFNEILEEVKHKGNPKGFSLHRVTLEDALNDGFLDKLKAKLPQDDERRQMDAAAYFDFIRSGCASEESFLQEYMCVPADDATAFLDYQMITACEYHPTDQWEWPDGALPGKCYIGVDVGRVKDLTVIWVLEKVLDTFYTRKVIELRNVRFADQEAALYPLLQNPNMVRCCIDNTGIGRQFAERAQERFGTYKVEPITFTMSSKEEMAYPVRAAFEDGRIRIPENNLIRADLRGIKKIQSTGDHVRFAGERTADSHCDRFWSLALAILAGKSLPVEYGYEPVGPKHESFRF